MKITENRWKSLKIAGNRENRWIMISWNFSTFDLKLQKNAAVSQNSVWWTFGASARITQWCRCCAYHFLDSMRNNQVYFHRISRKSLKIAENRWKSLKIADRNFEIMIWVEKSSWLNMFITPATRQSPSRPVRPVVIPATSLCFGPIPSRDSAPPGPRVNFDCTICSSTKLTDTVWTCEKGV